MRLLRQKPADLHIRIGSELQSAKELHDKHVAETDRRIALLAPQLRYRLGLLQRDLVEKSCRAECQRRMSLRFDRSADPELLQQGARDRRLVEAVGDNVCLRWAIRVHHLNPLERSRVGPARAVEIAYVDYCATLTAEPARALELLREADLVSNAGPQFERHAPAG